MRVRRTVAESGERVRGREGRREDGRGAGRNVEREEEGEGKK